MSVKQGCCGWNCFCSSSNHAGFFPLTFHRRSGLFVAIFSFFTRLSFLFCGERILVSVLGVSEICPRKLGFHISVFFLIMICVLRIEQLASQCSWLSASQCRLCFGSDLSDVSEFNPELSADSKFTFVTSPLSM